MLGSDSVVLGILRIATTVATAVAAVIKNLRTHQHFTAARNLGTLQTVTINTHCIVVVVEH